MICLSQRIVLAEALMLGWIDLFRKTLAVALGMTCVSLPAAASESLSRTMLQFGSPRAALFALLAERPRGGEAVALALAKRLAVVEAGKDRSRILARYLTLSPILRYDNNTNGGMIADNVLINGIPFVVDEDSRAVADFTLGASVGGGVSLKVAHRATLSFDARTAYRRGVKHGFNIREFSGNISLSHSFKNWTYINSFAAYSEKNVSLFQDRERVIGLGLGRVFSGQGAVHDLSATLLRVDEVPGKQSRLRVNWEGGFSTGQVYRVGVEVGEKKTGFHLPRHTYTVGYSRVLFGRPVSIDFSHSREAGSTFIGRVRADRLNTLRARYEINSKMTLYASVEKRASSIDEFRNTTVNMWFSMPTFRY